MKDIVEVLAVHADQLNSGMTTDIRHWQVPPEQKQEFLALLQLAEQVKNALAPVKPSPAYKRKLGFDLIEMVRQRVSGDLRIRQPSPPRELLISAAIGSAVALAGGVVYFLRARLQTRPQRVDEVRT